LKIVQASFKKYVDSLIHPITTDFTQKQTNEGLYTRSDLNNIVICNYLVDSFQLFNVRYNYQQICSSMVLCRWQKDEKEFRKIKCPKFLNFKVTSLKL